MSDQDQTITLEPFIPPDPIDTAISTLLVHIRSTCYTDAHRRAMRLRMHVILELLDVEISARSERHTYFTLENALKIAPFIDMLLAAEGVDRDVKIDIPVAGSGKSLHSLYQYYFHSMKYLELYPMFDPVTGLAITKYQGIMSKIVRHKHEDGKKLQLIRRAEGVAVTLDVAQGQKGQFLTTREWKQSLINWMKIAESTDIWRQESIDVSDEDREFMDDLCGLESGFLIEELSSKKIVVRKE